MAVLALFLSFLCKAEMPVLAKICLASNSFTITLGADRTPNGLAFLWGSSPLPNALLWPNKVFALSHFLNFRNF